MVIVEKQYAVFSSIRSDFEGFHCKKNSNLYVDVVQLFPPRTVSPYIWLWFN